MMKKKAICYTWTAPSASPGAVFCTVGWMSTTVVPLHDVRKRKREGSRMDPSRKDGFSHNTPQMFLIPNKQQIKPVLLCGVTVIVMCKLFSPYWLHPSLCEHWTLGSPYWGRGQKSWMPVWRRCCEIRISSPPGGKAELSGSEVRDAGVVTHTCQKVIYNWGGPPQTTYLCPLVMLQICRRHLQPGSARWQ